MKRWKKITKVAGITSAIIITSFCLVLLISPTLRGAITQISGLAVAQTSIQWNNVKDAAVGDGISNGLMASGNYIFNGTSFDRLRGTGGSLGISTVGATTFTTGQITVDNVVDLIKASNTNRRSIILVNQGTVDVFIGPDDTVLATTGILLKAGLAMTLDRNTGAIYGITASSSTTIGYLEE